MNPGPAAGVARQASSFTESPLSAFESDRERADSRGFGPAAECRSARLHPPTPAAPKVLSSICLLCALLPSGVCLASPRTLSLQPRRHHPTLRAAGAEKPTPSVSHSTSPGSSTGILLSSSREFRKRTRSVSTDGIPSDTRASPSSPPTERPQSRLIAHPAAVFTAVAPPLSHLMTKRQGRARPTPTPS